MNFELPFDESLPEASLKGSTLTRSLIEGRIISPECRLAIRLGRVEGKIGVAEKLSWVVTVIRGTGHPNTCSNVR